MKSMKDMLCLEAPNIRPYRSFELNQPISVFKNSLLREHISQYFPLSNFSAKVVNINSLNEYSIKFDRYNDVLNVSHWHVRPKNLVETRSFAPIGLIASGVNVKLIDTGEIKRVMTLDGRFTIADDFSRILNNKLIVVLAEKWEKSLIESFMRK